MHSAETPLCACSLFVHLSVCACPSLLPVLDSRISFTFCVGTASCSLSKYLSNMFPIAPAQDFIGPAQSHPYRTPSSQILHARQAPRLLLHSSASVHFPISGHFFGVVNPMQARFFSFFRHTSRGFFRAILDPRYLPIDRYSGKGNCLLISVVFTG